MNIVNILEYAQALSRSDKKSLVGKTLKAGEEFGELAKVVLPYEQEYCTTHRFPNKEKILEEACDLTLCALSVPMSIGYSLDDISEMLKAKADKWAGLQRAHNKGTFPLPFEIHVTVNTGEKQKFIDTCAYLRVKPIVLDLQNNELEDVMTSSTVYTDNRGAYEEMKRISTGLMTAGFEVLREKIETTPWHPAAPSEDFMIPHSGKYFECHFNIIIENECDKEVVRQVVEANGCHLSRNKFKIKETSYNQMMTLRDHRLRREKFKEWVDSIEYFLKDKDIKVEKVTIEYAIYDSKESHDLKWLGGNDGFQ